MKKEWVLLGVTVIATVAVSLGGIRWFAPQLLGIPIDLQVVQVSEKLPPFYEGVFHRPDTDEREQFLWKDPYTSVRAQPFYPDEFGMGPNDLLGFRNMSVPNVSDIVIIGDSQTYGNNAILSENWPSQMIKALGSERVSSYSMATGGWGAVQYLSMADKALKLQPKVLVVAYYTGNDPIESFKLVYGNEVWEDLIQDKSLSIDDYPKIEFPVPQTQWVNVEFKDGVKTAFTPKLRHHSNDNNPAAAAGYKIMAEVGKRIALMAEVKNVKVIFTIIPTKELVYAKKVQQEKLQVSKGYQLLIHDEEINLHNLASELMKFPNAEYVNSLEPLQKAALSSIPLYPGNINGHPIAAGYTVIGDTIAQAVNHYLPKIPVGLVAVKSGNNYMMGLLNKNGWYLFNSHELLLKNGWANIKPTMLTRRDLANYTMLGFITEVNSSKYGPLHVKGD